MSLRSAKIRRWILCFLLPLCFFGLKYGMLMVFFDRGSEAETGLPTSHLAFLFSLPGAWSLFIFLVIVTVTHPGRWALPPRRYGQPSMDMYVGLGAIITLAGVVAAEPVMGRLAIRVAETVVVAAALALWAGVRLRRGWHWRPPPRDRFVRAGVALALGIIWWLSLTVGLPWLWGVERVTTLPSSEAPAVLGGLSVLFLLGAYLDVLSWSREAFERHCSASGTGERRPDKP